MGCKTITCLNNQQSGVQDAEEGCDSAMGVVPAEWAVDAQADENSDELDEKRPGAGSQGCDYYEPAGFSKIEGWHGRQLGQESDETNRDAACGGLKRRA